MANQTQTGKAFEYALINEFYSRLKSDANVFVIENEPFKTAKECFISFSLIVQEEYKVASCHTFEYLLQIEPRIIKSINEKDILQLELQTDSHGREGDVRDILILRSYQKWEIGISAKNNHYAVKHSRLSPTIDFGQSWIGIPCSHEYFLEINPVFEYLGNLIKVNNAIKWNELPDKQSNIYVPLLRAFISELRRLDKTNPGIVAPKLASYLIGNQDFYKVIKTKNGVDIHAFNLYGTLNQSLNDSKPDTKIHRLKLPNRLIEADFKRNSMTTINIILDEGWQISFRLHSAKTEVEASVKFDINLISAPSSLFTHHISVRG